MSKETHTTRALNTSDVCSKLGIARVTLYNLLKADPAFPKPIRFGVGRGAPRYLEAEVDHWLADKAALREIA